MDYFPTKSESSLITSTMKTALQSRHWRCRHGAIIKASGHITSGFNRHKNNPFITYEHSTIHAEIDALRKHSGPAGGFCISLRINRAGELAYAAPCSLCQRALREAKVRRVIYSAPGSVSGFAVLRLP